MEQTFEILATTSAPVKYPIELVWGILDCGNDDGIELPLLYPCANEWGEPASFNMPLELEHRMPVALDSVWLSLSERKFYSVESQLPTAEMQKLWQKYDFTSIVVGLRPGGYADLWLYKQDKSVFVCQLTGSPFDMCMSDFNPTNPDISLEKYCSSFSVSYDAATISDIVATYNGYMKQYCYRYLVLFERFCQEDEEAEWQKYTVEDDVVPELEWIEESLYDGTHDKLHDDSLFKYHMAGKPCRLAVKFHRAKSQYTAYFWFDDRAIREVFDRFYGAHPDTKTDLIIHIDPVKRKYELALFRYGLPAPVVIRDDAYQTLVFKDKFEDYRSDNYDQPRGAWIW